METDQKQKAVFLDRDGTLIEEVNFLSRIEDVQVFPFTREALQLIKAHGYLLIVVTNQSGIGRGIYSEAEMDSIHQHLQNELDSLIDSFYHCPHLPGEGCQCRKPGLGMIEKAQNDFSIEMKGSWMIGDKMLDLDLSSNAGIRGLMVKTGYGDRQSRDIEEPDGIVFGNILDAAKFITQNSDQPARPKSSSNRTISSSPK